MTHGPFFFLHIYYHLLCGLLATTYLKINWMKLCICIMYSIVYRSLRAHSTLVTVHRNKHMGSHSRGLFNHYVTPWGGEEGVGLEIGRKALKLLNSPYGTYTIWQTMTVEGNRASHGDRNLSRNIKICSHGKVDVRVNFAYIAIWVFTAVLYNSGHKPQHENRLGPLHRFTLIDWPGWMNDFSVS